MPPVIGIWSPVTIDKHKHPFPESENPWWLHLVLIPVEQLLIEYNAEQGNKALQEIPCKCLEQ